MTLREVNKHRTAAAILQAATEVLAEHGVETAPVDLIARRAGVAVGSIYSHYGSKEAVRAAAIEQAARVIVRAVVVRDVTAVVKTPVERLAACGRIYTHVAFAHPHEFRLFAYLVLGAHTTEPFALGERGRSEAVRHLTEHLAADITDAVASGQIVGGAAERAASLLIGAWTGVLSMHLTPRTKPADVAQLSATLEAAATALADGMRPSGAGPGDPLLPTCGHCASKS